MESMFVSQTVLRQGMVPCLPPPRMWTDLNCVTDDLVSGLAKLDYENLASYQLLRVKTR